MTPTAAPEIAPFAEIGEPAYAIKASWTDNKGYPVVIRQGTSTWGLTHVTTKHNLNVAAVRTTTKYPSSRVVESASSVVYRTPVNLMQCNILGICSVKETVYVRVVHNPSALSDGKVKGVITAYCETGVELCPDWVKNAANA